MTRTTERRVTLGDGREASVRWIVAHDASTDRDASPVGQLTVRVTTEASTWLATIARAAWDDTDAALAEAVGQALRRVAD